MIVITRIDNRLIHGQIVQGWLPTLNVSEVLIVSQKAQQTPFMQKMLRLALPGGYKLAVLGAVEAVKYCEGNKERLFIIIEDILTLQNMLKQGFAPKVITLGNTQFTKGKKQYSQGVFLSDAEAKELKTLEKEKNIIIEIRSLPTSLVTKL